MIADHYATRGTLAAMRPGALLCSAAVLAGCRCPEVPPGRAWAHPAAVVTAPPPRPAGAVRFAVGGDARRAFTAGDTGLEVLGWAFATARSAGAAAFLFLGDMERTPPADRYFRRDLAGLGPGIAFCPVIGNHETLLAGAFDVYPDGPGLQRFVRELLPGCVGQAEMPLLSARATAGRVYYSVDLPGGVHFVALDNVSPGLGFGEPQLLWLERDLASAHARGRRIVVGMHKAPAGNGVTGHSMDEDVVAEDPGRVRRESDRALTLFADHGVELVLASHEHGYWELALRGPGPEARPIRGFITGGLGAPLKTCAGPDHAFFHLILLDVTGERIDVTPVRRAGA
jgi:hypothetical protein